MHENEISRIVVDAAIEVHRTLGGPGLLEGVYAEALAYELRRRGLHVETELQLPISYKGARLGKPLRIDLLVEGKVVVEVKSVLAHNEIFEVQALTYIRLMKLKLALVINFGSKRLVDGIKRVVNKL